MSIEIKDQVKVVKEAGAFKQLGSAIGNVSKKVVTKLASGVESVGHGVKTIVQDPKSVVAKVQDSTSLILAKGASVLEQKKIQGLYNTLAELQLAGTIDEASLHQMVAASAKDVTDIKAKAEAERKALEALQANQPKPQFTLKPFTT